MILLRTSKFVIVSFSRKIDLTVYSIQSNEFIGSFSEESIPWLELGYIA